jgi:hypothetical protein
MPSHRMNSGTQAIDGIARSACTVGSSSRRRMILQELLAHIEDAPGVGVGLAEEQLAPSSTSACAIIGSRPAQASTSPRISAVLPSACCSSTGVMSFSVRPAEQRAHQEDVRIGAARHRDALALEVGDLGDLGILAGDQRGPFGRE